MDSFSGACVWKAQFNPKAPFYATRRLCHQCLAHYQRGPQKPLRGSLLSSQVYDALTPYPFTFGDPALYATYLLGTAIFCLLILFGQEWALHLWAVVAIIAAAWDFVSGTMSPLGRR